MARFSELILTHFDVPCLGAQNLQAGFAIGTVLSTCGLPHDSSRAAIEQFRSTLPVKVRDLGRLPIRGHKDGIDVVGLDAPTLVEARVLVESFQAMVRKKLIANLDPWIATANARCMDGRRSTSCKPGC
jgi:hypothetical protein